MGCSPWGRKESTQLFSKESTYTDYILSLLLLDSLFFLKTILVTLQIERDLLLMQIMSGRGGSSQVVGV